MHWNIFLLLITFSLMSSAVAQEHTLELTLEETASSRPTPKMPAIASVPLIGTTNTTVPTTCRRSSLLPIPIWTVLSTK